MSNEPLVSVALCTYNGARYLREQLDSLLVQTCRDFEIIAVDDGSTDDTLHILQQYQQRDARLRVYTNPVNLGVRRNFERALSLCAGRFIAPCDQDDIWLPEKLQALLDTMGEHAAAYCDSEIIDEQGASVHKPMSSRCNMLSTDDPAVFAAANCVSGHAMLFRRELIARALPVPDCFYYDWWLAAVAACSGGVVYCDRKLVSYRFHESNVTNVLRARPSGRSQGRREARLRDFRLRLEYLAALPSGSRDFLQQLHTLWRSREDQWFSFALGFFMYRHWRRIFAVRKSRWRLLPALKFVLGLRLKRITNPVMYRYG